jgi:hypothetical protein
MDNQKDKKGDRDRLVSKIISKEEKEVDLKIESPTCKDHNTEIIKKNPSPPKIQKNDVISETISSIQSSEQNVKKGLAEMIEEYKHEA